MSWESKVLWTEGLFLQPHHFQQADRYHEAQIAGLAARIAPYAWGMSEIEIDTDLLKVGQFNLRSCSGLTPDGAVFRVPGFDDHPPALDVPAGVKDCIVYLTVPQRRQGALDVDMSGTELSAARFRPDEIDIRDTTARGGKETRLAVGKLRLQFALEVDDLADRLSIPIARIIEVRPDQEVVLDSAFIPSCLDLRAAAPLRSFLDELTGLLVHRMTALSGRLTAGAGAKGTAEIQDLLLLMTINRTVPLLRQLSQQDNAHPITLFRDCVALAGELSSLLSHEKRPNEYPAYQHHNLTGCFLPVIRDLRTYLSAVLEQTAVAIPIEERKFGIWAGRLADRKLIGTASFVLAVSADIPAERVRRHFAGQAKIGPVEEIRQLVNSALPGIGVTALPVAPRQIPYSAGVVYFELDASSPYWGKMTTSGGIAVHVSGEYPGLNMELWAIRRS
ncbi:type VI secretion system baseplate subunit TssK [Meridianimarinicoccus roseus]|jgi:type VI secretion system protein ImpJ|uniref:Type VI secretion system baseplate subunit TssK n=1 Tax=Meridianimarinicoccus roseus TaxID=2072018 RepID=A0A2V2L754_9RHOB|nr:type VI secretion system baseplate subunit TssK [Meridianimarinicoccus roseus]PWR01180.1 type VI secretion system baseplate subunit TssK [Meridianimarinicoccus roseus]